MGNVKGAFSKWNTNNSLQNNQLFSKWNTNNFLWNTIQQVIFEIKYKQLKDCKYTDRSTHEYLWALYWEFNEIFVSSPV